MTSDLVRILVELPSHSFDLVRDPKSGFVQEGELGECIGGLGSAVQSGDFLDDVHRSLDILGILVPTQRSAEDQRNVLRLTSLQRLSCQNDRIRSDYRARRASQAGS